MKELKPLITLISAILLACVIIPVGIVWNIGKSILHARLSGFMMYWLKVLYQIWNVIKYLLLEIAVAIDLLGNATSGEFIEDCITATEQTLLGRGNVTISAATGELESVNELNKTGRWFSRMLSRILGKDHCAKAYKKEQDYPINE